MNFFENNEQKTSGVFLTARHLSWLIASIIFLSFFVFIAGYFFGKKKGAEKFYHKIEQDSLADQIYYSMYSLYDTNGKPVNSNQEEQEIVEAENSGVEPRADEQTTQVQVAQQEKQEPVALEIAPVTQTKEPTQRFYALLAGFGTLKAAELFAQKLQKNHISIKVNKRESKTAKGKVIHWYQAVTDTYNDKAQLQATLELIKKVERLKDIQIKTC